MAVFLLLLLLAVISVGAAVGTIVMVSRDGYGRIAREKHVRIF